MRTAIVHEWLTEYGGSEMVMHAIASHYPAAPIYTLVHDPVTYRGDLSGRQVIASWINRLPLAPRRFRGYLPLFPLAVEQFDLRGYDLVVSSSHAVAKGVLTGVDQLHVCYCHTPVRYAWDLYHSYLQSNRLTWGVRSMFVRAVMHYLRLWDIASASRVDQYVANSRYVARRIRRLYGRESEVIHPPVDVERFDPTRPRDDFFLTVSRLVPYKRIDLMIDAFNQLGLPLVVIGDGPMLGAYRERAGVNVQVLGYQDDSVVADHLERCRAFVFAADEDFGIVPVEAQAAGAPVLAYGRGGVLDTVQSGRTGLFFDDQSVGSLVEAVGRLDGLDLLPAESIASHADQFSRARFDRQWSGLLARLLDHRSVQR